MQTKECLWRKTLPHSPVDINSATRRKTETQAHTKMDEDTDTTQRNCCHTPGARTTHVRTHARAHTDTLCTNTRTRTRTRTRARACTRTRTRTRT